MNWWCGGVQTLYWLSPMSLSVWLPSSVRLSHAAGVVSKLPKLGSQSFHCCPSPDSSFCQIRFIQKLECVHPEWKMLKERGREKWQFLAVKFWYLGNSVHIYLFIVNVGRCTLLELLVWKGLLIVIKLTYCYAIMSEWGSLFLSCLVCDFVWCRDSASVSVSYSQPVIQSVQCACRRKRYSLYVEHFQLVWKLFTYEFMYWWDCLIAIFLVI